MFLRASWAIKNKAYTIILKLHGTDMARFSHKTLWPERKQMSIFGILGETNRLACDVKTKTQPAKLILQLAWPKSLVLIITIYYYLLSRWMLFWGWHGVGAQTIQQNGDETVLLPLSKLRVATCTALRSIWLLVHAKSSTILRHTSNAKPGFKPGLNPACLLWDQILAYKISDLVCSFMATNGDDTLYDFVVTRNFIHGWVLRI